MVLLLSDDLTQKAIKILLGGGTLLSEPCPYCKGVRVMKDGNALCVNCGKSQKRRQKKHKVRMKMQPPHYKRLRRNLKNYLVNLKRKMNQQNSRN